MTNKSFGRLIGNETKLREDLLPNDITPMAWKMPPLMVRRGRLKDPLSSLGVRAP
jgi:hypothetical protein